MKLVRPRIKHLVALSMVLSAFSSWSQNTFKIGEINSYKAQPAFLDPYKKGMD